MELGAQEVHIGRAMDCAIRTDDAMVSRHHARLYWHGGDYYVEDLGSANGVFYQEQRVTRHALNHGDAVRCGSLWLRFVDTSGGQAPADADRAARPPQPFRPPSQPMPRAGSEQVPPDSQPIPAQPSPVTPAPSRAGMGTDDAGEIMRLRRRIEQLQTELRMYRRGSGADAAQKIEDLENENLQFEEHVSRLQVKVEELEDTLAAQGVDAKLRQANELVSKTSDAIQQLNDILSNLRINVMAAEGEFEQFSHQLPRASFELIREALHSSSGDVDSARELLRKLRDIAD